jgi:hypothetical protein
MSHTHVKGKIKETKIKTARGRGHKAPDPFTEENLEGFTSL